MGRKLDSLFKRSFRTSKFKATVNLAVSRLTVLRNQRQARCSVARSDVVQLLNHGQHERALLRVEHVVKEQNMLDVYMLIDGFCHLLIERVNLLEQEKDCPEELKEAIASLIYASTRCGDFPELQEIRAIFGSRFGREFVGRAVELRNNCGVNPKMIQKLSTRMPSLENRMRVLKEIASEVNIVLQLEEVDSETTEGKLPAPSYSGDQRMAGIVGGGGSVPVGVEYEMVEGFSDSTEMKKKYKDVADAAHAAFRSAAFAAAAARAAVELSRTDGQDPDDPNNPKLQPSSYEDQKTGIEFDKIHPAENYSSDSESEDGGISVEDKQGKNESKFKNLPSSSSMESLGEEDLLRKLNEKEIVFDESEDDSGGEIKMPHSSSHQHFPSTSQVHLKLEKEPEKQSSFAEKIGTPGTVPYDKNKKPISLRTRKTFGR